MKSFFSITFLLLFSIHPFSQDSLATRNKWDFNGYLKELQLYSFNKNFGSLDFTNLIHNRLNLKWKPSEKFTGAIEVRNRFYWGDEVRSIPGFKKQLRNNNEWRNLSAAWLSTENAVVHSNVERLWLEFRQSKWNLRAGRQRINWGLANTWNPNDIFNTYNFLDFDYEERPGSDAVKYQYLLNELSHLEVAVASTRKDVIAAAKYSTNYSGYDLQLISGVFKNHFTLGFGWAGSIADVGFKGEGQLYSKRNDSANHINITVEGDYIFKDGWYISSGILYNNNGLHNSINDWSKVSFQISPTNLMPARWNILVNTAKEFTPRFNGSVSVVYSPGVNMVILFPSLKYNLQPNTDIDLVWQSFFSELETNFQAITHRVFLRLKWNF